MTDRLDLAHGGRLPAETSERGGAAERQPGAEQRGREQPGALERCACVPPGSL